MDWVRDKGPELQLYFNLFQFNSYLFLLINFVYKAGDTPLMYALGKGISYPIIEFMIDKGANVKDKSKVIIFFYVGNQILLFYRCIQCISSMDSLPC